MSAATDPLAGRRLRIGLWNCHGTDVAEDVLHVMRAHKLDVLLLSEASHAAPAVRATRQVHVVAGPGSQANVAMLVRPGVDLFAIPKLPRMTTRGWITVRGGHVPDRYLAGGLVDGWLMVGGVHLPPSTWRSSRVFRGPKQRVATYRQHMRSLRRWINAHRKTRPALFVGADWNCAPAATATYSPRWLARVTGLQLHAAHKGTHGRREIDYALMRGVRVVSHTVAGSYGSDHQLVVYVVERKVSAQR
jgi:endonuclease/exonuclease/phosphatase (EEP) superfamily protein YafD